MSRSSDLDTDILGFSEAFNFLAVPGNNASISVKPEGGGPRAYVGHLTSIAFPTLGNLTENLGPRVGMFAFFTRRNGTKSYCPMCSLRWPSWKLSTAVFNNKAARIWNKNSSFKSAPLILTVLTNAFHLTNIFLFSRCHVTTNSVAPTLL